MNVFEVGDKVIITDWTPTSEWMHQGSRGIGRITQIIPGLATGVTFYAIRVNDSWSMAIRTEVDLVHWSRVAEELLTGENV